MLVKPAKYMWAVVCRVERKKKKYIFHKSMYVCMCVCIYVYIYIYISYIDMCVYVDLYFFISFYGRNT